jgi:hypothetical protein
MNFKLNFMKIMADATAIKYGLICGLITTLVNLVIYLTESYVYYSLALLGLSIPIIGMVFAHLAYKREGNGYLNYWKAVRIGTGAGTISNWISAIIGQFYLTYIDAAPLLYSLEKQRKDLYFKGLSEEAIEQAMQSLPSPSITLLMGLLTAVIISFIFAMIISIFTKHQKPQVSFHEL